MQRIYDKLGISPHKVTPSRRQFIQRRWKDVIVMCSPQKKLVRRDLLKELATADASLRVIKGIIIIMFENELQTRHCIQYQCML